MKMMLQLAMPKCIEQIESAQPSKTGAPKNPQNSSTPQDLWAALSTLASQSRHCVAQSRRCPALASPVSVYEAGHTLQEMCGDVAVAWISICYRVVLDCSAEGFKVVGILCRQ